MKRHTKHTRTDVNLEEVDRMLDYACETPLRASTQWKVLEEAAKVVYILGNEVRCGSDEFAVRCDRNEFRTRGVQGAAR
jgi:hypothetical protein